MSYIGTKPADQVLDSTLIADGTILTADLANGAVTSAKITDSSVTPAKLSQSFTSGTAVASTSGTSITFTSIPSWAKRVTVMFNGVSTNGGSDILIRIGSGSVATSGYVSYAVYTGVGTAGGGSTAGFRTIATSGGQSWNGFSTIVLQNSSTNSYCSNGLNSDSSQYMAISSGSIALAGVMDRVQVTTANGTDTFDAGSINILYE